jgi:4-amino-4-deoxy-L-arabinose transferase-like glycosyltransferase
VSESLTSIPEEPSQTTTARVGWAILILLTLYACYFSHLGAIGFVGPDEPRYAWIARDMAETGDWVTPRLYGKPWFEKPPLYYWGAALCFKVFGVSETAARLPSAISALLATLALAWLAWRLYGEETARWLMLLLPTTVGMIGFSHAAATDMPFSAMLTIAMVFAAIVIRLAPAEEDRASTATTNPATLTPWVPLILFGGFLGLAVLAKGPVAIILSGGAVFFWAIFTKRWRDALHLLHPGAIAAFCLTALPWYILCASRNPDFFRVFIIEHNFKRFLTPEFQHIQPFWFYLPVVVAALLPWSVLSVCAGITGTRRLWVSRALHPVSWFFFCWPAFTVLFFSVSRSKLPGYILPALPPLALFTARAATLHMEKKSGRWVFCAGGLTLVLMGVLVFLFNKKVPFVTDIRPSPGITKIALLAIIGGILGTTLASLRRATPAALVIVLAIISLFSWSLSGQDYLELDEGVSARPMVQAALEHLTPQQTSAATVFKLRRSYKYQVDFYLHRETQQWSPQMEGLVIVFTDYANARELEQLGGWCPQYDVFPRVWVCEGGKGTPILMHGPASCRQPK